MQRAVRQRVGMAAVFWFASMVLALTATVRAAAGESEMNVRIRLEWGGGAPRVWSGVLEIDAGRFEAPASLGIEADEPGTVWIDQGALWLQRRSPRVFDGFDVTVIAKRSARLSLTLQSTAEGKPERIEFGLEDFMAGPRSYSSNESEIRYSVRRAPGDALRLAIDRPHLVFSPEETLTVAVKANASLPGAADTPVTLDWQLRPARAGEIVRAGSVRVDSRIFATPATLNVEVPRDEGVYDLVIGLAAQGVRRLESQLQFVVVSPNGGERERDARARAARPVLVDSFEPAKSTFLRRVERRAGLQQWNESFRRMLQGAPDEAQPARSDAAVQWSAYRLKVRRPGTQHRVVVSLVRGVRQSAGISLLEPNAAGQLMPAGIDSGRHVSSEETSGGSGNESLQHEITFWPRGTEPILLLHDFGTGEAPQVERVELFEAGAADTEAVPGNFGGAGRLVGPYLHKPMFCENFGATESLDELSGRSLDDWKTFYEGGTRLASYLRQNGYNSVMLASLADGSTLYPSAVLEPTPRYDTGTYFATGQDPMRKDALELLFRLFDREGLVLVPELQFSTPLPALERQLHMEGDKARGIELIGRDGRSWRASRPAARGLAPYYNPLDPRVQKAILDAVAEVAGRYGGHASYRGVAIELSSAGYLHLPGLNWGYDDETVRRFEAATGVKVPVAEGAERYAARHAYLTGEARDRWVRWRCEEVAKFYRALADTVASSKRGARLILAGNRVLRGSNPDDSLYDALKSGGSLEALLAPKGLDFKLLAGHEAITILRPSIWGTTDRVLGEALDATVNYNSGLENAFGGRSSGHLFYHLPRELRVAEFDAVSPWQPAYTWLVAQGAGDPLEARKRFARALASADSQLLFEGSWMIRFGEEGATRAHRDLFRALPAVEFHLNEVQRQPAVVRIARTASQTFVYVVNDFPRGADLTLKLSCPAGTAGRMLGRDGAVALTALPSGESTLAVRLEGYGVWGCVLDDPAARVLQVEPVLSPAALVELRNRIQRFDTRMADVQRHARPALASLENPGFEKPAAEGAAPPGWEVSASPAVTWEIDRDNPRSGQASLVLASSGDGPVSLSSNVSVEDHRLATMHVWLRSNRPASKVRLLFEATVGGKSQSQGAEVTVDDLWRRYTFRVSDLPPGRLEGSRVRVEGHGPGKVWVDDLEVELQKLTPDDLRQLTKVFSAVSLAFEEKRYSDCQRLLESFWGEILKTPETPLPASEPFREASKPPPAKRG